MFAGASENMNDTDTVSMILSGWRAKKGAKREIKKGRVQVKAFRPEPNWDKRGGSARKHGNSKSYLETLVASGHIVFPSSSMCVQGE